MARSELSLFGPRSPHRGARSLLVAVVALAVPAVVACNSLIGLDEFDKGQCPGARCTDDGSFPDVVTDGGADVFTDALPDSKGADPVSWAKWPMPNYGEGGAGQPPRPPLLSVAGENVTDAVTQLVWHSTLIAGDFPFAQVSAACAKLANGPWRVPKRIELVSLIDYARTRPFIDTSKFPAFPLARVWSTSEVRPLAADREKQAYWVVNFDTGAVETLTPELSARVLCVRAK